MEDGNREFQVEWTVNFGFIQNLNELSYLILTKFAHNKKSNLERHFTRTQASFSTKYNTGDARKKAVEELQKSQESSNSVFNNWMQSSSNINLATKKLLIEGNRRYTAGEYIKKCINTSQELLSLSAKTIKDRTIKMCSNIITQHIEHLKLVSALSIAVDESCAINDAVQVLLF
ncbi:hypothetical protein HUJ05_006652, partial [Dendroctonus ponderosae]